MSFQGVGVLMQGVGERGGLCKIISRKIQQRQRGVGGIFKHYKKVYKEMYVLKTGAKLTLGVIWHNFNM